MLEPTFVEWLDSCSWHEGWKPRKTYAAWAKPDVLRHEAIGFLVAEDDASVTLALSKACGGDEANVLQAITIPKAAIVRRKLVAI
jgi:hypothetical protein